MTFVIGMEGISTFSRATLLTQGNLHPAQNPIPTLFPSNNNKKRIQTHTHSHTYPLVQIITPVIIFRNRFGIRFGDENATISPCSLSLLLRRHERVQLLLLAPPPVPINTSASLALSLSLTRSAPTCQKNRAAPLQERHYN